MINGTVIGPVVAPPESNAIPIKLCGQKIITPKRIAYKIKRTHFIDIFKTVRKSPIVMKIPTPAAITKVKTFLLTKEKRPRTCDPKT